MHNAALRRRRAAATGATSACRSRRSCSPRPSRALPAAGFAGANVTIPHKEAALALADEATADARARSAPRTRSRSGPTARIAADNTDAPGLLAALGDASARAPRSSWAPAAAARAAVYALRAGGRRRRGLEPHRRARRRRSRPTSACARSTAPGPADVLVNCTSVGLQPDRDVQGAPVGRRCRRGVRVRGRPGLPGTAAPCSCRRRARRGCPYGRRAGDPRPPGRAELRALDRARPAPLDVMRAARPR